MKKRDLFVLITFLLCCVALLSGCANGLVSELFGDVIHEHLPILSTPPIDITQFSAQSMQVSMDYGMHRSGLATPLLNSCTTEFLDKDVWDLDVFVPGDVYHLTYMGVIMVQETYPGTVILPEGGLLDVSRVDAGIVRLEYRDGQWQGAEQELFFKQEMCEYVILDEQGNYCALAEYDTAKPLYVTYSIGQSLYDPVTDVMSLAPLAAYAYAPRDTKQHAFYTNLDYGSYRAEKATVLMDSAVPFIDQPLIAGDIVYVSYTGDWLMEESYPGKVVFVEGEVKRVDIYPARVCALRVALDADGNKILVDQSGNQVQQTGYYVLTDADGSFTTWSQFEVGTRIYASYSAEQGIYPTNIAGLYLYLPRD